MEKHKSQPTQRERVESALLAKFPGRIKVFEPMVDHPLVNRHKNGTFGFSNAGFALYSNGYNPRGRSALAPLGLLYQDGENAFSISYFTREGDRAGSRGYLFIVAPTGRDAVLRAHEVMAGISDNLDVAGFYVRFLTCNQYVDFLSMKPVPYMAYIPAKQHPWHPEAPEEDETLSASIVPIRIAVTRESVMHPHLSLARHGFENFLKRHPGCTYTLEKMNPANIMVAREIVERHFRLLQDSGKRIGSTAEDYFGCLSEPMLNVPGVVAFIGLLNQIPVSVFVAEAIYGGSEPSRHPYSAAGVYTSITLRDRGFLLPKLGIDQVDGEAGRGFGCLSAYAFARLFAELELMGFKDVHLGGSEHPDLNRFKRGIGARNDPTYWIYAHNPNNPCYSF